MEKMKAKNLLIQGDPEVIRNLGDVLKRYHLPVEIASRTESPDSTFRDMALDVAVVIVTIVGGVKPLISALVEFHKTHSTRNANKEFRLTIEGKSIELNGFDDDEIAQLTDWLSSYDE